MTYEDIYNVHRSSALIAYGGNPLAPNMSLNFAASLTNSWQVMYNRVHDALTSGAAYWRAFKESKWYDLLWFMHAQPENMDALEADYQQFVYASFVAPDDAGMVNGPQNLWNAIALLARQMDATSSSPPEYATNAQVVDETLADWADKAKALASSAFDAIAAIMKNLVLIGAVGIGFIIYLQFRKGTS